MYRTVIFVYHYSPGNRVTNSGPTGLVGVHLPRQPQRDGAPRALSPLWPMDGMGGQICAWSSLDEKENKEFSSCSGRCGYQNNNVVSSDTDHLLAPYTLTIWCRLSDVVKNPQTRTRT